MEKNYVAEATRRRRRILQEGFFLTMLFHKYNHNDCIWEERKNMKIKKVQSAGLILACIAATGLIGCGKTDETSKKHDA